MQISFTNVNKKASVLATLATILLANNAFAQGIDYSVNSSEDSLLPPEVVPIDSAGIERTPQTQAQINQDVFNNQSAPGLVNTSSSTSNMQTAQEARKAMFDQLMGQNQVQPINANFQNSYSQAPGLNQSNMNNTQQVMNQNGQNFNSQGQQTNQQMSSMGTQMSNWNQPGQSTQVANNFSEQNCQMSNWNQPGQVGSQTLTGGVQYQPVQQSIRRGGISNAVSAVAGIGTGLFLGSLISRSYYGSPFGLGLFGLGMTGFGMRNGFRW